jgi:hypothetical protein
LAYEWFKVKTEIDRVMLSLDRQLIGRDSALDGTKLKTPSFNTATIGSSGRCLESSGNLAGDLVRSAKLHMIEGVNTSTSGIVEFYYGKGLDYPTYILK